jgi:hypothetical protein
MIARMDGSEVAYFVLANLALGIGLLLSVPLRRWLAPNMSPPASPRAAAMLMWWRRYQLLIIAVLIEGGIVLVPWLTTHDISRALPLVVGVLIGWAILGILVPVVGYLWGRRVQKQSGRAR